MFNTLRETNKSNSVRNIDSVHLYPWQTRSLSWVMVQWGQKKDPRKQLRHRFIGGSWVWGAQEQPTGLGKVSVVGICARQVLCRSNLPSDCQWPSPPCWASISKGIKAWTLVIARETPQVGHFQAPDVEHKTTHSAHSAWWEFRERIDVYILRIVVTRGIQHVLAQTGHPAGTIQILSTFHFWENA